MNSIQHHWQKVYQEKSCDSVSWFQPHATASVALIEQVATSKHNTIADIGSGASTLVDDLLAKGFDQITLTDIAASALQQTQQRLGKAAEHITWIQADVLQLQLARHSLDIWHDRAVFHFLTKEQQRQQYLERAQHSIRPGGHLIIATFAEDGPERCSNLPTQGYSIEQLKAAFAPLFTLKSHHKQLHTTPFSTTQPFIYACFQRNNEVL